MPLASTNAESDISTPTALISLFTIDSRFVSVNGNLLYFTPGVNGLYKPITFRNITYAPFPIELTENQIPGQGSLARPHLKCSNINGFLSAFLLTQGDLTGAKVTITRVYSRYLPHSNFANGINPFGTPDPTAAYEDEIWFIARKISENPDYVEVELQSCLEIGNIKLPSRQLNATVCSFRYRDGETCGYSDIPVSDRFGKLFTAATMDGGYGYTLNARGAWASGNTYAVGDWVSVVSENDFTIGQTLVYVCAAAGTTGTINNPQFNATNWVADACPHNLLGCDAHFDSPLPAGFAAGISRASYLD